MFDCCVDGSFVGYSVPKLLLWATALSTGAFFDESEKLQELLFTKGYNSDGNEDI